MRTLAFETSCDETSAAVVDDGAVRATVIASQINLHAEYGGVVPELATREHLRNLAPVTQRALTQAGLGIDQIDLFAATQGPGLPNALWVGFLAGQTLGYVQAKPFFGIHHHEAHLYSPWIGSPAETIAPSVSLIVSGGHTLLVHVERPLHHRVLGETVDDAAGECFDKVAKLLGLPYPGGPAIDRLAHRGDPRRYSFPRPMLHSAGDDFSFSGLKTSVRYLLRDHPGLADDEQALGDLCASVQAAIVEVLVTKTIRAARRIGVPCVTASGGVTCNRGLRRALTDACAEAGLQLRLARPELCTDNAAMIGVLAQLKASAGCRPTSLDAEVQPGWEL